MRTLNKLIMTVAGLLLMAAALLKAHELMNVGIPSWKSNPTGFWESYEFLLMQIPLEFALGAWMVSGLFRKAAWVAGTLCYFGFIGATLVKALLGYESCGCFGQVHVDPWMTLWIVDIPFFLLLAIFRPKGTKLLPPPWPNVAHAIACAVPILAVLALAAPAIVTFRPEFKKPQEQTQVSAEGKIKLLKFQHEQEKDQWQQETAAMRQQSKAMQKRIQSLEKELAEVKAKLAAAIEANRAAELAAAEAQTPDEPVVAQVDQTQPPVEKVEDTNTAQATEAELWDWLEFVVEDDVRTQLSEGMAVVLMYHHDCPTCADVVPAYSAYYKEMNEQGSDAFKIAFLAVPPYAETGPVPADTTCILGKLTEAEKWELMSPYVVVLLDGELMKTWPQGTAPDADKILDEVFGQ